MKTRHKIVIATRKSPLAWRQAELVRLAIAQHHPQLNIELLGLQTRGDKILDSSLATIGGKGLFTKELEQALFERHADLAVHSMKDLPVVLPIGLCLPVILQRDDPRDALLSLHANNIETLAPAARIGTSSLRRKCQLLKLRPDLIITNLRGNINTRIQRLQDGELDGIILAVAGMSRMNWQTQITAYIPTEQMLPAAAQGALGIECRDDDHEIHNLLAPLHDTITAQQVFAERAVTARLQGGCQFPLAAHATSNEQTLHVRAVIFDPDNLHMLTAEAKGHCDEAANIGETVAQQLLAQGAQKIIDKLYTRSE